MAPRDDNLKLNDGSEKNFFSTGNESQAEARDKIYGGDNHQPLDGHIAEAIKDADIDPKTGKKKERTDELLLKLAAEAALDAADIALSRASEHYAAAQQIAADVEDDIDRADYLKDEITKALSLLKKGTQQDKSNFLLEHGLTQDQIDAMSPEQLDESIFDIASDMIEEHGTLTQRIEQQFKKFEIEKDKFDTEIEKANKAIEEARANGASEEKIQELEKQRDGLVKGFDELKDRFGQSMVNFRNENHEKFNQEFDQFVNENRNQTGILENKNIAKKYLVEGDKKETATSIAQDFKEAADGIKNNELKELIIEPKEEVQPIASISSAGGGLDF